MHKKLRELEDLWGERCTDEAKFSWVRMASEQRTRIIVRVFPLLSWIINEYDYMLDDYIHMLGQAYMLLIEGYGTQRGSTP